LSAKKFQSTYAIHVQVLVSVQATVGLLAMVCSTVGFAIGSAVCVATADATVEQAVDQAATAAVRLNRPAVASRSIPI
jgi:hypothetical protein